ncbi:metal ABC transporter ATP-binding protein [Jeotgalicoccus nanhaiensis]|uniref:Metal ABC transporter ATP-binding protein n=1 Tax=Jeotgalicoccus nanhaiensis TaxID=568603 RepID=A0ABR9XXF7_9STAP|nr:metal ABC transporter ATP-binding protein [Jeotgalicoccus nanhaiensis]MBF0753688.1 metal ABC transporter ATP-binding protein [Jeotgalicoccus nanhaiensis]TFU61853.1 metal ABC transporter ATP-binding protein [Jeotgalicoccus nanhaiensis]
MKTSLEVKNLTVSYSNKIALTDVNFSMESGKLIGIIGPNGSGKSTLMKAVLNLTAKDSGEVQINEKTLEEVRGNIAYIPQRSNIDWDFPILVRDTVLLGTYPKLGLFNRPKTKEKKIAEEALKKVGMEDFADKQIGELSGGQQQRVFLARSLAQNADIFFMDEPFVGIDIHSEEIIINILKELRDQGKTLFVIHHDLTKVEDYFDELILVNKELVAAGAVSDVFTPELMERTFNAPLTVLENMGGKLS